MLVFWTHQLNSPLWNKRLKIISFLSSDLCVRRNWRTAPSRFDNAVRRSLAEVVNPSLPRQTTDRALYGGTSFRSSASQSLVFVLRVREWRHPAPHLLMSDSKSKEKQLSWETVDRQKEDIKSHQRQKHYTPLRQKIPAGRICELDVVWELEVLFAF